MQVVMTSRLTDLNVSPSLPLSVSAGLFRARSKTLSSVTQIRIDCPHVRTEEGRKKGRKEAEWLWMLRCGQKLCESRQPHRSLGKPSQVRNGKLFRKIEFGLHSGLETWILIRKLDSQRANCSVPFLVKHRFRGATSWHSIAHSWPHTKEIAQQQFNTNIMSQCQFFRRFNSRI